MRLFKNVAIIVTVDIFGEVGRGSVLDSKFRSFERQSIAF
jgi:hypothetical protein